MERRSRQGIVFGLWLVMFTPSPFAVRAQQLPEGAESAAVKSAVRAGSFKQVAELLERAARSGNAEAQYQLASLYRSGRGVTKDEGIAFKWMQDAAGQGHTKAQFSLGKMYLAGHGIAPDRNKAESWLHQAAARGNDNAIKLLAELATVRPQLPLRDGETSSTGSNATPGRRLANPPSARRSCSRPASAWMIGAYMSSREIPWLRTNCCRV